LNPLVELLTRQCPKQQLSFVKGTQVERFIQQNAPESNVPGPDSFDSHPADICTCEVNTIQSAVTDQCSLQIGTGEINIAQTHIVETGIPKIRPHELNILEAEALKPGVGEETS
jgi:hypothetical protein